MKQQRTILIVDRFPVNRQTYQQHLSHSTEIDYKVLCAESGSSALKICGNFCESSSPQTVLLNPDLIDIPGAELL